MNGNETAREGAVFVCGCCGKRSRDLYGDQPIDLLWDESCMLHAVLCKDPPEVGEDGRPRWEAVKE